MEYRITEGTKANALEVYFDGKPAANVIDSLKAIKMRWAPSRGCWYGFTTEEAIKAAIDGAPASEEWHLSEDIYTEDAPGYMGATETTGSLYKAGGFLYGADLSKAIRKTLKKCGFKGFTVSVETYSGGQSITLKVKARPEDIKSVEEYTTEYELRGSWGWCKDLANNDIHIQTVYYTLPESEREAIRKHNAELDYNRNISEMQQKWGLEWHNACIGNGIFTEAFIKKISAMKCVLNAYNHDDSNSMVDYFDRHFYETIRIYAA